MNETELMERALAEAQATNVRAADLRDRDPSLPYLTSIIVAGDMEQAERALTRLTMGEEFNPWLVGSYSRMAFLISAEEGGYIDHDRLLDLLIEGWPASDPDDTDPRFLVLWKAARARAGDTVCDGPPLPDNDGHLTIYRGQRPTDPIGIAWSLDRGVAQRFANGASFRVPLADGIILTATVKTSDVLAYLTDRNEAEIIVDPATIQIA